MLAQRVLTAIVLAALVLIVVFVLPRGAALFMMAVPVLAGAWEWAAFAGIHSSGGRFGYTAVVAATMLGAWWLTPEVVPLQALLWASVCWWGLALLWVTLAPARVNSALAAICGVIVLVPAWLALARLYLDSPDGPNLVLFVLVVVAAADIGAFLVGRSVGRVKLAPMVSPGKTWEGLIGGVLAALGVGYIGARWFDGPIAPFLLLSIGAALASVVGDLTESMFKRHVGIKDSGQTFPGHGGVMDRIDGVMAATPVLVLGLGWLSVVE